MNEKEFVNEFRYLWNFDEKIFDVKLPLPESFIHFNRFLNGNYSGMLNGHCYGNSLFITRHKIKQKLVHANLKLCVGLVVSKISAWKFYMDSPAVKDKPIMTAHAWNLTKSGKIFDISLGSERSSDKFYFGRIVPDEIKSNFKDAPCVRNYLWSLLGLRVNEFHDEKTKFSTAFNYEYGN